MLRHLSTLKRVQLRAYAKSEQMLTRAEDLGWEFKLKLPPKRYPTTCDAICWHALPLWLNPFWTKKKK